MGSSMYLLLALGLYAFGALDVLLKVVGSRRLLHGVAIGTTLLGFAVHTASLSQRWTEAGHFPAVGSHDGASLLGWVLVAAFLLGHVTATIKVRSGDADRRGGRGEGEGLLSGADGPRSPRDDALSLVVQPTAFLLLLVASVVPASSREEPALRSLYLPVHATLAFFGYGALFVGCAMGLLYLLQESALKAKAPGRLYYLGPSLTACDALLWQSVKVGFALLSLAIVTGSLYSHAVRGRFLSGDPKELSAFLAWGIYVGLIALRRRGGFGGRRGAVLGILGFAVSAFIFVWMTLLGGFQS